MSAPVLAPHLRQPVTALPGGQGEGEEEEEEAAAEQVGNSDILKDEIL